MATVQDDDQLFPRDLEEEEVGEKDTRPRGASAALRCGFTEQSPPWLWFWPLWMTKIILWAGKTNSRPWLFTSSIESRSAFDEVEEELEDQEDGHAG